MPQYCFMCVECDTKVVKTRAIKDRRKPVYCQKCESPCIRDLGAEHKVCKSTTGWPMYSDAMGVHPDQIPEAVESAKRHGVPTDFLPDGRVEWTSPSHRKNYCRAYGVHDKNGGYGDP